jgi:hypothetical protein
MEEQVANGYLIIAFWADLRMSSLRHETEMRVNIEKTAVSVIPESRQVLCFSEGGIFLEILD